MIVNDFFQFLVVKRTTWEALNVDQWKKKATSIWSMKMETTAVIVERNILLKYICNVESNRYGIINNYCMRLSKISWFGSGCIIRSPSVFFDYWRSNLPFSRKSAVARRRKAWFHLRMGRMLFAAKHGWTTLRMSRTLSVVGSYLQGTLWAFGK